MSGQTKPETVRILSSARMDNVLAALGDDVFRVWFRLKCWTAEGGRAGSFVVSGALAGEVAKGDPVLLARAVEELTTLELAVHDGGSAYHLVDRQEATAKPSARPDRVKERVQRFRAKRRAQRNAGNTPETPPGGVTRVTPETPETPPGGVTSVTSAASVTPETPEKGVTSRYTVTPETPQSGVTGRYSQQDVTPETPQEGVTGVTHETLVTPQKGVTPRYTNGRFSGVVRESTASATVDVTPPGVLHDAPGVTPVTPPPGDPPSQSGGDPSSSGDPLGGDGDLLFKNNRDRGSSSSADQERRDPEDLLTAREHAHTREQAPAPTRASTSTREHAHARTESSASDPAAGGAAAANATESASAPPPGARQGDRVQSPHLHSSGASGGATAAQAGNGKGGRPTLRTHRLARTPVEEAVIGTLTEMTDWTQRDEGDPTTRWLRQVAASFPEVDLVALAEQYRDQRHTAPPSFNRFRALAQRTSERRAKPAPIPTGRVRSARDHDFS